MTVKEAAKIAYESVNKRFHPIGLVTKVRVLINRPYLMEDTVLRKLRELRSDGVVKYIPGTGDDFGYYIKESDPQQQTLGI